jgi:pimeloyl-ACP methyl ester carboxylesterase
MTRILVCATLAPFLVAAAVRAASPGPVSRTEEIRIPTTTMPKPVAVRLWLPAGFDEAPTGSLPLLVFLHDGYGSQKTFSGRKLDRILDGMIARGEVPPMVVASPRTFGTYNSNDRLGKVCAFDFLVDVLVPELLSRFPQLRRDRAGRGLTGISMGAYGSLKVALRRPELLGAVSALSPWVEDLSFEFQKTQNFFLRLTLGRVFGKTAETSSIRSESLFVILDETGGPRSDRPRLLLVTGDGARRRGHPVRVPDPLRRSRLGLLESVVPRDRPLPLCGVRAGRGTRRLLEDLRPSPPWR